MNKDIKRIMISNDFYLVRTKKHAIWRHSPTGVIVTTAKTPKPRGNALFQIKRDIKNCVGAVNE